MNKLKIKTPITNASEGYLLNLPNKSDGEQYTIAVDEDVVHKTGNETIAGIKSFENSGASLEVSGSRIYWEGSTADQGNFGDYGIFADTGPNLPSHMPIIGIGNLYDPTQSLFGFDSMHSISYYQEGDLGENPTIYTYTFPNKSGTIVVTGDLTNFVAGPASSTENAVALYNDTTGKVLKNSGVYYRGSNPSSGSVFEIQGSAANFHYVGNGSRPYIYVAGGVSGDLGSSSWKWHDLYLSDNLSDGNGNSITVANIVNNKSNATNISNDTATGSLHQLFDSGYNNTIDMSAKNPNAWELYQAAGHSGDDKYITKGATGQYATSLGGISAAAGKRALADGTNTIAIGKYSHAEGDNSVTLGNESHAEGYQTVTNGDASHAEGVRTQAIGNNSHAEGELTKAIGHASHAGGYKTIAGYDYQTVIGKYNANKEHTLLEVGYGWADGERHNALEVYDDGHVEVGLMGSTNLSVATKEYVDNRLGNDLVHKTSDETITGTKTFSNISFSNIIGSDTYKGWISEQLNALSFRTRKGNYDLTQGNIYVNIPTLEDPTATNISINFPTKSGTVALDEDVVHKTGTETISGVKTFAANTLKLTGDHGTITTLTGGTGGEYFAGLASSGNVIANSGSLIVMSGSSKYTKYSSESINLVDTGGGGTYNYTLALPIKDGTIATLDDINNLDASKITSGTFADARIASANTWNSKIADLEDKVAILEALVDGKSVTLIVSAVKDQVYRQTGYYDLTFTYKDSTTSSHTLGVPQSSQDVLRITKTDVIKFTVTPHLTDNGSPMSSNMTGRVSYGGNITDVPGTVLGYYRETREFIPVDDVSVKMQWEI